MQCQRSGKMATGLSSASGASQNTLRSRQIGKQREYVLDRMDVGPDAWNILHYMFSSSHVGNIVHVATCK